MLLMSFIASASAHAFAYSSLQPAQTADLRFHQHIGAALPLDAEFRDASGRRVRLGDFFGRAPVVVVLEYLHCRTLCGYVLRDTVAAIRHVPLASGRDYQVLAISIDPRDGPADARAARAMYLGRAPASVATGWHFLTGGAAPIRAVADAEGFSYRYDPAIDQYAHPAGIAIATPRGRVARYLLGLGYRPLDLRLALSEAGRGQLSSPVADLLLLCYCYDPGTGRYSFAIGNLTRALCALTVLGLALLVWRLARERGT
jgi:protein SCO1